MVPTSTRAPEPKRAPVSFAALASFVALVSFGPFVLLAPLSAGCNRAAPDATPEGAVRAWLDRMEASDDDAHAIREAYALLGPAARANLGERADRASRLEGHRVEPWEMLAEGRFALKFRTKSMVSHVDGDVATVAVTGDEPLTEHALVHCARVAGPPVAWRVEPDLPPVPPLPRRDPDRAEVHTDER